MWSPNGWDHGSGVPGEDGLENPMFSGELAGEHVFSGEVGLQNKCSPAGCAASNRIGHVDPNSPQRRAGEELSSTVRLGGGLAGDRRETGGGPR